MNRVRATPEQLSTLLEYMETHGDQARPHGGPVERFRSERRWSKLTILLNAVGGGVTKSTDKWKKVWADWKSKTKIKGYVIRRQSGGTRGEPASRQSLSATEERVLALMAESAVKGQASKEKLGSNTSQSSTVQNTETVLVEDTVFVGIVDETPNLPSPQPSSSQRSSTSRLISSQPQTPPRRRLMRAYRSAPGRQPPVVSLADLLPSPSPPLPSPSPPLPSPSPPLPYPTLSLPSSSPPLPSSSPPLPSPSPPLPSPSAPTAPPTLRRRRRWRLPPTPFERAAKEFTAFESRRLELEETRTRLQHEREMRVLDIEHERNQVFQAVVEVARDWLESYRSNANAEPEYLVVKVKKNTNE